MNYVIASGSSKFRQNGCVLDKADKLHLNRSSLSPESSTEIIRLSSLVYKQFNLLLINFYACTPALIIFYYMAGSASGQDEANPMF